MVVFYELSNELLIITEDTPMLIRWDEFETSLKELACLIHKKIASLFLTARGEAFPEVIEQNLGDEIACYLGGTPDEMRSVGRKVVLHQGSMRQRKRPEPTSEFEPRNPGGRWCLNMKNWETFLTSPTAVIGLYMQVIPLSKDKWNEKGNYCIVAYLTSKLNRHTLG
jgi:hypothetical protein